MFAARTPLGFSIWPLLLGLLSACADSNGVDAAGLGVSGEVAAELCQMYCADCGGLFVGPEGRVDLCPGRCRAELADPCGERVEALLYCEMGVGVLPVGGQAPQCSERASIDSFCAPYHSEWYECLRDINAACEVLGEDAPCVLGTVLADACIPVGNPNYVGEEECQEHVSACLKAGGDCNADFVTEMCRWVVRADNTECSVDECISLSRQARAEDGVRIPVLGSLCPPPED